MLKEYIKKIIKPLGKTSFLKQIDKNSRLLDVGCGNNSPIVCKSLRPDLHYVGIDIQNYNQSSDSLAAADDYIVTTPENFDSAIDELQGNFEAIISSHNLEHCIDRGLVLKSMLNKLANNGRIYLAFPSNNSIHFPKRVNTLNYYDDPTHVALPPDIDWVKAVMNEYSVQPQVIVEGYRPLLLSMIGFLLEPISKITNRRYIGVWEYYGFETIIIAKKNG